MTAKAITIGPIALPDGTTIYLTTADNAPISLGAGNFLVGDFGDGGTISVGNGNSDIFAVHGGATVTTGNGSECVIVGAKSVVTTGANDGLGTDMTLVSAGHGSTVNVGDGRNIVWMNGGDVSVTTGTGTNAIYDLANGDNTVTLGNGMNWAFLHGCGNMVHDGTGTDTVWLGSAQSTLAPNAGGGVEFVYAFGNSDRIDVASLLGANADVSLAGLMGKVMISEVSSTQFAGAMDSTIAITGSGGTATMTLFGYNAGSLTDLVAHHIISTTPAPS